MVPRDDSYGGFVDTQRRGNGVNISPQTTQPPPAGPTNTGVSGYSNKPGGTQPPAPKPAKSPAFKFSMTSVLPILQQYAHTSAGLAQAFKEHPELAASGAKITGNKGDSIIDPRTGEVIDVVANAGEGGTGWQWYRAAYEAQKRAAQGGGGSGSSGSNSGGGGGSVITSPTNTTTTTPNAITQQPTVDPQTEAMRNTLIQQLLARATQSLDINANDPVIRNQVDAYRAEQERAKRDYLSDQAESASPYATGNTRLEQRMASENLGQNVAGFQANLVGQELQSRRSEIQSALDSMGNLLSEKDRLMLQEELAQLDASLERMRIGNQNSQFYAGLNSQDKQFYDQLAQRQNEWADQMGFNEADRAAYWDAVRRGDIG